LVLRGENGGMAQCLPSFRPADIVAIMEHHFGV
jgi:hypothetical protein